jgi:hypothetical protein
MKQIAMQLAPIAARDPGGAHSIERLGDGSRGYNYL